MLSKKDINDMADKITSSINPLSIYLFGSYASRQASEASDLDLFIEIDNNRNVFETKRQINSLFITRKVPIDFLVYTTAMKEKSSRNLASFYSMVIQKEGIKLYERY